ncbi:MAG: FAD/NAD(P)-binding protein [Bacteriovorax sp.]|nr:FAD/NAD(P)-binding protein [Bacteriovorax sp.]
MKAIGIVGGGFSGTMTAVWLMKNSTEKLQIYLIEKDHLARGQAYADIDPHLLLNVRADQMGAFPDDIGHFYRWLQDKKIECSASDFISRKIYGDYLSELLAKAIKESAGRVLVEIIKDQVIDLDAENKKLVFETHTPIQVDEVVLAIGLKLPAEFNFTEIKAGPGPITIIGTGLSMVDVVVYLHSIGHQGKITAVSRRGRAPLAHQFYDATVARPVYDFTKTHSLRDVLSMVRGNLKRFEWRLVIDGLRPHTQLLWSGWNLKERSQFLRYLRPIWDIHRHRISSQHQKILNDLKSIGRLEIKAIGFGNFQPETQIVMKCHGLTQNKSDFVKKLIEKKLVTADCFQLGIESQTNWIHTIGPLKRGQLWESLAVPEIRKQAHELANHLVPKLVVVL